MPIELTPIPAEDVPQGNVRLTALRTGSELPIAEATVWVTSDSAGTDTVDGPAITDAFGTVRFFLASGTGYYFWLRKASETPLRGTAFTASETSGNTFHTTAATVAGGPSGLATALLSRVKNSLRVTDATEDMTVLRLIDEGIADLQQHKVKTITEPVADADDETSVSPLDIRYIIAYVGFHYDGTPGFERVMRATIEQIREQ